MPEAGQRLTPDEAVEQMRKDIEIELVHDRDQLTAFNVYYSSPIHMWRSESPRN